MNWLTHPSVMFAGPRLAGDRDGRVSDGSHRPDRLAALVQDRTTTMIAVAALVVRMRE
jgi:hypothetical protein